MAQGGLLFGLVVGYMDYLSRRCWLTSTSSPTRTQRYRTQPENTLGVLLGLLLGIVLGVVLGGFWECCCCAVDSPRSLPPRELGCVAELEGGVHRHRGEAAPELQRLREVGVTLLGEGEGWDFLRRRALRREGGGVGVYG